MSQVEAYTVDKELMVWSICITLRETASTALFIVIFSNLCKKSPLLAADLKRVKITTTLKLQNIGPLYYTIRVYF